MGRKAFDRIQYFRIWFFKNRVPTWWKVLLVGEKQTLKFTKESFDIIILYYGSLISDRK